MFERKFSADPKLIGNKPLNQMFFQELMQLKSVLDEKSVAPNNDHAERVNLWKTLAACQIELATRLTDQHRKNLLLAAAENIQQAKLTQAIKLQSKVDDLEEMLGDINLMLEEPLAALKCYMQVYHNLSLDQEIFADLACQRNAENVAELEIIREKIHVVIKSHPQCAIDLAKKLPTKDKEIATLRSEKDKYAEEVLELRAALRKKNNYETKNINRFKFSNLDPTFIEKNAEDMLASSTRKSTFRKG